MYNHYLRKNIEAGWEEVYQYNEETKEKIRRHLIPNDEGWYSIKCDGGEYYSIGTSTNKYGIYVKT